MRLSQPSELWGAVRGSIVAASLHCLALSELSDANGENQLAAELEHVSRQLYQLATEAQNIGQRHVGNTRLDRT